MSAEPTRREFIQTAAVAVGSLILPVDLRANQNCWSVHIQTGESWAVDDLVAWCLHNSRQPILKRAQEGLLNLTATDKDRVIRLVTRRCSLNLIEIISDRVVVHHWGQNLADLRPFFKTQGLAQKYVEVVVINRKKETNTVQSGDDFLFGVQFSQDWPTEIYLSKWERRNEQEPDDSLAASGTHSGFAWDGVENNLIPWAAMKSAWR